MIEQDRVTTAIATPEDEAFAQTVRPRRLADYIGGDAGRIGARGADLRIILRLWHAETLDVRDDPAPVLQHQLPRCLEPYVGLAKK